MQILTIDFDIVMGPSANYYEFMPPHGRWEKLKDDALTQLFYGDYICYYKLTNWLLQTIANGFPKEHLFFIFSHDKVASLLSKNEKYDIINIDHHHDISYSAEEAPLECGNWVEYLYKQNCINSYTWIHNPNSCFPMPNKIKTKVNFNYSHQNFNEFDLNSLKPDLIIICLSPEWVPPHIVPLFQIWMDMASYWYNQKFEIE